MNASANVFFFGDFNAHHKDWLTYSGGIDRLVNSVIIFLSQVTLLRSVNSPIRVPDCDSHGCALLDLFISFSASIYITVAFPPFRNFNQVVVSVFIDFPSYSQWDASFHRIAYDYSRADWDGLRDYLRDVPLEDILKLSASAAAS